MLRFRTAETSSDATAAAASMAAYKGQDVNFEIDYQSFYGRVLDTVAEKDLLRVDFVFDKERTSSQGKNEHIYRYLKARSEVKATVRFKVYTDEVYGVLEAISDVPMGGSFSQYAESKFSLVIRVKSPKTAKAKDSAIIGIDVPNNIQDFLPFADDLEYDPHITVAYFPEITEEEGKEVVSIMHKVAGRVGSFDVTADRSTTFPNQQSDGTYPLVALVNGQGLFDYHDLIIDLLEYHLPGLVSTEFVHQNYQPHVTLEYVKVPNNHMPITPVVWGVEYVTLNAGPTVKVPLHRERKEASVGSYLQVGDERVFVKVRSNRSNHLKLKLRKDPSKISLLLGLSSGDEVGFVTPSSDQALSVLKVKDLGSNMVDVYYRVTRKSFPKAANSVLSYVRQEAERRSLCVTTRIGRLLDLEDKEATPEDTEAFGPGSPGTFSDIATYSKSVQSQDTLDPNAQKFQRAQDLVDRL